jgi:peptidoglycan/xylan/chitin deacetylase (PgdA/CDA1 family)
MSILCYHSVSPDWRSPLSVTPQVFDQHCAWLASRRTMVDLDTAVANMKPNGSLPSHLATVTFDDGFSDLYEHALPVLMKHKIPCTIFVVVGTLLRQNPDVTWVDDPPQQRLNVLSLDQIHEMRKMGVQFASHSYSHHDLTKLSDYECELDLRESRILLEDLLGSRVRYLAYPRGFHNERVRKAAQKAGYSHAFAMMEKPHIVDKYAVTRVGVFGHNGLFTLGVKISPWYVPVRMGQLFSAGY